MALLSERLAFVISANADQAIRAFESTGRAADRELGKAESRLDRLGSNMTRFGAAALAAAGVAGRGLISLAQGASDLNETISKAEVIFGDAAEEVLSFSQTAARSLGQSQRAALDAAGTFGTFGKAAGLTGTDLAGFSTELVKLSADLASFYNATPEEAVQALGGALRGEAEPMRRFGVLLNDASLKAKAMELGLYDGTGALDQQARVLAAYEVILDQTKDAQGDFARTSDGAANQSRILQATMEDLKNNIGMGVLPVYQQLLSTTNSVVGSFASLSPEVQTGIGKFAAYATAATGVVGALSLVGGQLINMRDRFTTLGDDGTRSLNKLGRAAVFAGGALTVLAATDAAFMALNEVTDASGKTERALQRLMVAADQAQAGPNNLTQALSELADTVNDGFRLKDIWQDWGKEIQLAGADAAQDIERLDEAFQKVLDTSPQMAQRTVDDLRRQAEQLDKNSQRYRDNMSLVEQWQERINLATGATDALTRANMETTGAADEAAAGLAGVGEAASDSTHEVGSLEDALRGLLRQMSQEEAYDRAADGFDQVRTAAVDAYDSARRGSEAAEEKARSHRGAVRDLKDDVIRYAEAVGGVPASKVTEIFALIDQGRLDEAERKLNDLGRPRRAAFDVVIRGGTADAAQRAADTARRQISPSPPARATGGPVMAGRDYLVGEHGPEVVRFPIGGHVAPASQTGPATGGGVTVIVHAKTDADARTISREVVAGLQMAGGFG